MIESAIIVGFIASTLYQAYAYTKILAAMATMQKQHDEQIKELLQKVQHPETNFPIVPGPRANRRWNNEREAERSRLRSMAFREDLPRGERR